MSVGTRTADITPAPPLYSVGTTASIAIGLGALGASTAGSMYATHSANKTNQRSQDLQSANDVRAADQASRQADFEEKQLAQQKAEYDAKIAADQGRWQDYLKANQPMWNAGAGVLQNLFGLAHLGNAPKFSMPGGPAPTSADMLSADGSGGVAGFPAGGAGPLASTPTSSAAQLMPTPAARSISLSDLMQLAGTAKGLGNTGSTPFGTTPVIGGT